MRPPGDPLLRRAERNLESVQAEIAREKAAALSRAFTGLRDALAALERFDAAPGDPAGRAPRVAAAAEALWRYVVQREACGLRDVDTVLRELRVPREVYLRMGSAPPRR